MDKATLLQIVPRAPGNLDGVGDYARQLALGLLKLYNLRTTFVSAAPSESGETNNGFQVVSPLRTMAKVPSPPTSLLLHYVNYGYDPRGIPLWLPSVIRRLQRSGSGKLVTVFHELYATGSWRQSAFWLRPLQMRIARSLACMSATSIVSNEVQGEQLKRLAPEARIVVQPVPSNFGEPEISLEELEARDPHRWVICGGTELILRSLDSFLQTISYVPQAFTPRQLCIVGGRDQADLRAKFGFFQNLEVSYHPGVDAGVASDLISKCAFGWIDYFLRPEVPMAALLKSTAFAALCAHGVIPVLPYGGASVLLHGDSLQGPFFANAREQNLP
ncbi:MAG: hypothetical protein M3R13_12045, partial [Armatimonadota bacterium]|nr:hypothetical protein [Armatimonadota bacterium]